MSSPEQVIERRIADALSAHAGGITMGTSTLEQRFAQVQERTRQDRRRRRLAVVTGGALATAAAVLAAFVLVGGLPWQDDAAQYADREVAQLSEPYLVGDGTPEPGTTYSVEQFPVPFTFSVPPQGDVPGTWHYGVGDGWYVNLDASPSTGHAGVGLAEGSQVYAPDRPWTEQDQLVDAPTDAAGWVDWLERTGYAEVTAQERLEVGGAPATRIVVAVADELPDSYRGCAPGESCLAFDPFGPGTVGSGFQAGLPAGTHAELTVIELGERTVLATAVGAKDTADQWAPLMRSVVDSLRFV